MYIMIMYFQKICHSMIQSFCYGESDYSDGTRHPRSSQDGLQPLIVPRSLQKVST
jgi:hypothetical protein